VYADDTPPPAEGSGDETAPPQDANPEPESAPAAQPESVADTGAADPEQVSETPPATEPQSVSEVLEQIPDDTDVVVLDAQGEAQPLASQAAADAIVNGDPMWCPDGVLPGGVGCTGSFTTFTGAGGLLEALAGGSYTGNGTIYVETTYNSSLETGNVIFDGTTLTGLGNLTIQGGWDGVLGSANIVGTSLFGVSLGILDWGGSVTANDLTINTTNTGLVVESAGNIVLDNVDAQSSNFYGAYLDSTAGSGTVQVTDSDFSDTGSLTTDDGGLTIVSNGDVTLTNVTSNDHENYGALIGTSGDVTVTNSTFNNQDVTGLYVESGGAVTLDTVTADNNLVTGAYLDNTDGTGSTTITDSTFTNNGGAGTQVISNGGISLDNVTASDNGTFGAKLDSSSDTGSITVANSTFDDNDIKGLYVESESSGDITLNNVTASNNGSYGAFLEAYGIGNIFVDNSTFNGNGEVGLAAMTGEGDITLTDVTVDGSGITDIGAWLGAYGGGAVNVTDSTFQNMTDYGLKIGTSGPVNLTNVTASNNGSHGVTVYNPYACYSPQGIDVTVDGGTFQNNGGYGLYVAPGPLGTLTFGTLPLFGTNTLGNYLLSLSVDCDKHDYDDDEYPETPKKPVNVVELPATDGDPVEQDCETYSGTELDLPNGTTAEIDCPFDGTSLIEEVGLDGLPAELPLGPDFVSGVSLDFSAAEGEDGEGEDGETENAMVTLSFDIPTGMEGEQFSILYWDPAANDGQGDWVELPLAQLGVSEFPLNPNDSDDPRTSSGVQVVDGKVTVTVNFPGTFVLVAR
jgi:hypothetical protein